jgi:dolichyl-phosphate beta-glucosyltransferase
VKPVDLSIIIPAYQEAVIIQTSLMTLASWLETHHYGHVEVLVVVADSADGTAELALGCAEHFKSLRVIQAGTRVGKGRDVRIGMFEAKGRYRLFMDADLATPLHHLDDVWELARHDKPVIIATRNLVSIHRGLIRKVITGGGNLLAQIILLPGIKDTQCGFKAFRADVATAAFSRMTITGWGFDLEILAICRHLGFGITAVKAPDWHDPKATEHGLVGDSASRAALQVLRDLFQVRWNLICRRYQKPTYIYRDAV